MIDIANSGAIKALFDRVVNKHSKRVSIKIEFTAPYAAKIHEDLNMVHPHGGQAKYLETPLRLNQRDMQEVLENSLKSGEDLDTAMKRMAEFGLEKAKELVPVRSGFLRDSGVVTVEAG